MIDFVSLVKQRKPNLRDTSVNAYVLSLKSLAPADAENLEFLKDAEAVTARLENYKPNTRKNQLNAAIVVLKGMLMVIPLVTTGVRSPCGGKGAAFCAPATRSIAPLWAGLRFCLCGIATALAETARLMRLRARLRSPSQRLTRMRPIRRDMESAKARSCRPLFMLLCP
jgi:hypothetical protein